MNKAIIMGRLVKDPELRYTPGTGTAVTSFTVAVNRRGKKDEADFINCVAFKKTAETISTYIAKGQQILIEGHITTGSYQAKDGSKRYTTEITVENFSFIGNKKSSNSTDNVFEEPFDEGDIPW